ncbi:uncharacterized protein LOC117901884 [Drosophila subobscura]|uniref:uncharacterized protein LOC117901884 n=1 Tax=Drosophila subobscura TaxID=7241 RepID=UPI00155A4BBA|nr:uncharacterized protein LOC117901884 [Drosophila subobscura]
MDANSSPNSTVKINQETGFKNAIKHNGTVIRRVLQQLNKPSTMMEIYEQLGIDRADPKQLGQREIIGYTLKEMLDNGFIKVVDGCYCHPSFKHAKRQSQPQRGQRVWRAQW